MSKDFDYTSIIAKYGQDIVDDSIEYLRFAASLENIKPSYWVEDFKPHAWVVAAVAALIKEARDMIEYGI